MSKDTSLENCWVDEREKAVNQEIHKMLSAAEDAIDLKGPLESVTAALAVIDKIRAKLVAERDWRTESQPARDPAWDMTEGQLIASYDWARNKELRRAADKLDVATQALIHTRAHMIDEDDDAYPSVHLIEDALIEAGDVFQKVLSVIDPKGQEGVQS